MSTATINPKFDSDYDEARYLGELVAYQDNFIIFAGVANGSERRAILKACRRLDELVDASDDPDRVIAAYWAGYDERFCPEESSAESSAFLDEHELHSPPPGAPRC